MTQPPTPLTAEEYLDYLIKISPQPGAVCKSHLVLLRKLITEGKTGVYSP